MKKAGREAGGIYVASVSVGIKRVASSRCFRTVFIIGFGDSRFYIIEETKWLWASTSDLPSPRRPPSSSVSVGLEVGSLGGVEFVC